METLKITAQNLETQKIESMTIKASNRFMLVNKLNSVMKNIYITAWEWIDKETGNNAGNNCQYNSGAYLAEFLG